MLFCDDAEEDVGAFFDFNGELVLLGAGLLLLDRLRVVIGMASDGGQLLLLWHSLLTSALLVGMLLHTRRAGHHPAP